MRLAKWCVATFLMTISCGLLFVQQNVFAVSDDYYGTVDDIDHTSWHYAKNYDFIRSASVTGYRNENGYTYFDVIINFGSACQGCVQVGGFHCNDPGDRYTTIIDDASTGFIRDPSQDNDSYEAYLVQFYPSDGNEQAFIGYVYKPKWYTLTGTAVSGGSPISTSGGKWSDTVQGGNTATIEAGANSCYDFKGWSANQNATSGTGGQTYSQVMNNDDHRWAIYKIKSFKLNAYAITNAFGGVANGTYLNDGNSIDSDTVNCGGTASVSAASFTGYNFLGWRKDRYTGTPSGNSTYTETLNASTGNEKVYAVYTLKTYKLTIDAGTGTSIKVVRGKSPYGKASTGELSSGATLYYGDELTITYDKNGCYDWSTHTVNGSNISSGYKVSKVTSDVAVQTRANLREYKLTKSQATGTTVTVKRESSPNGGGSTKSLKDGAKIYCGDTLKSSFGLNTGYSWGNYDWAGYTNKWGYHFAGANTGTKGDSWNVTGPSNATNHDSYSSSTYTVDGNVTAESQAVQDEFKGRARVDSGSSISSSTRETTGYTSTTKTASKTIECANEGCATILDLYAKTTQGTGSMKYNLGTSNNGGTTSWVPALSFPVSANPATGGTKMGETKTTLYPGQSICRYLRFTPLGTSNDKVDAGSCMFTIESLFQGKVSVSGSTSGDTGWSNTSTEKVFYANNCTNGCTVSFTHEMKRTQGIGSTDYKAVRRSNLTETPRAISDGDVASGTFRPSTDTSQNGNAKTVGTDGTYKLYPGMKVCEKLTFKPSNNVVSPASEITVTTCALALGNSQPDDPSDPNDPGNPPNDPNGDKGSDAFIDIEVKNDNVSRYGTYRRYVYAKPNDVLTYRASYNPTLQYTYYLKPQKMQVSGSSTVYPAASSNTVFKLGELFNASTNKTWKNYFSVQKGFQDRTQNLNAVSWNLYNNYTNSNSNLVIGSMDSINPAPTNQITVSMTHVGQSLNEKARTNLNSTTRTTPGQVTFTCTAVNSNICTGYNKADVDINERSNIAYARIPYNFTVHTEITTPETKSDGTPNPVYAGEEMPINYDINVDDKPNCETSNNCGEYSTDADDVRREIVVYNPDTVGRKNGGEMRGGRNADVCSTYFRHSNDEVNCGYAGDTTEDLNSGKNSKSATFNAQDWEAGKKVCVAVAVFPAHSGADTNWNDMNYSNSWRISDSKCYTIAKRPSLQIWGGNFYSTGNVTTAISKKNNIKDYTAYSVSTKNNATYIFGSWGELGVISVGSVDGLASGAGTGFAANFGNTLWPSYNSSNTGSSLLGAYGPGGNKETGISICLRNKLTFANYPCTNTTSKTGSLGGTTIKTNGSRDKSAIIQTFMRNIDAGDTYDAGSNLTLGINSNAGYYKSGSSITLNGSTVQNGTYAIESTSGNVTIAGNITYAGNYHYIYEIPKIVIHAENININCGVTRIDAVLIADGTVTTCADAGDNISDAAHSAPLKINGTIIADKLVPNRTYGAAAGANSIIPAEVINYDSTLYVWGSHQSDSSESGKLTVTYTKELAPRF